MTTIVAGFPRCGSSLVMRLLYAGGIECAYDHELSMELEAASVSVPGTAWFEQARGRAVKVLDPHRKEWPAAAMRWIWIDRDPTQQAKSQAKLLRLVGGFKISPMEVPSIANSIISDRSDCIELMDKLGGSVLFIRFEDIIERPMSSVISLLRFCGSNANPAIVAGEIVKRSTDCLTGLLELSQLARYEP